MGTPTSHTIVSVPGEDPGVKAPGRPRSPGARTLFLLDVLASAVATALAFDLRFETLDGFTRAFAFAPVLAIALVARPIVHIRLGLYRRLWRYASLADMVQVALSVGVGSVVALILVYGVVAPLNLGSVAGFPGSYWPIEALLTLVLVAGSRVSRRVVHEFTRGRSRHGTADGGIPTLLFGAGEAGAMLARSALRDGRAGVLPVGFLDDARSLRGRHVAGLPVFGGLGDLDRAVRATGAKQLLITMPNSEGAAIRRVTDASSAAGLTVRTVPAIHELLNGTLSPYQVRPIQLEDLLRRPLVTDRLAGVEDLIAGRTVMVTGGGGSIGSELARQVWALRPARLVLVDRAESALYAIERELEVRQNDAPVTSRLSVHLANVASRAVMDRLMQQTAPSIVFHAAAYKHVPLMETHPSDAVHVNVGGTLAVLEAAASANVERFVLVSSDKAVEPSSVMGATKRVAEWLVADVAARTGRPYVSVRFGNVLGSNGSVVPIFQRQLERGEPLTITDPGMTRYFMTIPEAAWLILDAAALGRAGDLFVLDMGEPINIVDLARDLARLAGRDPDAIRIDITGLRPGEKLTETLFYDAERIEPTASPKVMLVAAGAPPVSLRDAVRNLLLIASGEHDDDVRRELFRLVNGRPATEEATPEPVIADDRVAIEAAVAVHAVRRIAAEVDATSVAARS